MIPVTVAECRRCKPGSRGICYVATCWGRDVHGINSLHTLARQLVAEGFYRGCRVQTFTATGTPSIQARLGWLADHVAAEPDKARLSWQKWEPFQHAPPAPWHGTKNGAEGSDGMLVATEG